MATAETLRKQGRGSQPIRFEYMEKTKDEIVLEMYTIIKDLLLDLIDETENVEYEIIRHKIRELYEEYRD